MLCHGLTQFNTVITCWNTFTYKIIKYDFSESVTERKSLAPVWTEVFGPVLRGTKQIIIQCLSLSHDLVLLCSCGSSPAAPSPACRSTWRWPRGSLCASRSTTFSRTKLSLQKPDCWARLAELLLVLFQQGRGLQKKDWTGSVLVSSWARALTPDRTPAPWRSCRSRAESRNLICKTCSGTISSKYIC